MNIKEIIGSLEQIKEGCCKDEPWYLTLTTIIETLKTYPDAQPNEPLTLSEMQKMYWKPVWIDCKKEKAWGILVPCGELLLVKTADYAHVIYSCGIYCEELAAKLYRCPPKERCGTCSHFIGCGDFSLCCRIHQGLCYEETSACKDYKEKVPPIHIRTWEELNGLVSEDGKYKIEVDLKGECGYIRPTFEVEDPEADYHAYNLYLHSHTFYGKSGKSIRDEIKQFGFNIEIIPWDET